MWWMKPRKNGLTSELPHYVGINHTPKASYTSFDRTRFYVVIPRLSCSFDTVILPPRMQDDNFAKPGILDRVNAD